MMFKFLKTVLTTCRYAMCISLGVLSVSGTVSATLRDSIAALEEGARYRVLFVTNGSTTASSGEIDDYNTFVSNAAGAGALTDSLGLTWKALLSTDDMNAQDNTGIFNDDSALISMFDTKGQIVASSGVDLWNGSLDYPIGYDENRTSSASIVWTGTLANGDTAADSVGGGVAAVGEAMYSNYGWAKWMTENTTRSNSLYAVSSVSGKALTYVPKSSTIMLLTLGLACLACSLIRKKP
jgi:hypothetical protein